MRKLNILLVDDNPNFLKAAREVLAVLPGVAGVECAASGEEALALAGRSRPDLVLTDLVMPAMSGFEVIRNLRAHETPPRIVVLTLHEGAEYRAAARRSGADSLVPKHEFGAHIPALIASLASNGNDKVRARRADDARFAAADPAASAESGDPALSPA